MIQRNDRTYEIINEITNKKNKSFLLKWILQNNFKNSEIPEDLYLDLFNKNWRIKISWIELINFQMTVYINKISNNNLLSYILMHTHWH